MLKFATANRFDCRLVWPKLLNFALVFVVFYVYLYRNS